MKSISTLVAAFTLFVCVSSASAQVQFEGSTKFSAKLQGSRVAWTTNITRVSNYNYADINPASLALVVSRSCSSSGNLSGLTVAKTQNFVFPARWYYSNVNISGTSAKPTGKFCVHFLALSGKTILARGVFNKSYSFRGFGSGSDIKFTTDGKSELISLGKL